MQDIKITVELCSEDRARLDNILQALIALVKPQKVAHSYEELEQQLKEAREARGEVVEPDPLQQMLKDAIAGTPASVIDEAKPETTTTTPTEPETPTEAQPFVTLEDIQQKVMQLATVNGGAKKDKVRGIINNYAKKVSDIPADKWPEVWEKLNALEKED